MSNVLASACRAMRRRGGLGRPQTCRRYTAKSPQSEKPRWKTVPDTFDDRRVGEIHEGAVS
jgi:hypothetical protein